MGKFFRRRLKKGMAIAALNFDELMMLDRAWEKLGGIGCRIDWTNNEPTVVVDPVQAEEIAELAASATDKSVTGTGTAEDPIELDGDADEPGNDMEYATNDTGVRGWLSRLVATAKSITGDGKNTDVELVGDAATPGVKKHYGTNAAGTKGWQDTDDAVAGIVGDDTSATSTAVEVIADAAAAEAAGDVDHADVVANSSPLTGATITGHDDRYLKHEGAGAEDKSIDTTGNLSAYDVNASHDVFAGDSVNAGNPASDLSMLNSSNLYIGVPGAAGQVLATPKTLASYTSTYTADDESVAYTAADPEADDLAKLADLNALRVAYENIRAAFENLKTAHDNLRAELTDHHKLVREP